MTRKLKRHNKASGVPNTPEFKKKESLSDKLNATTSVTIDRKAAVTLSTAYNWKEWTYGKR